MIPSIHSSQKKTETIFNDDEKKIESDPGGGETYLTSEANIRSRPGESWQTVALQALR